MAHAVDLVNTQGGDDIYLRLIRIRTLIATGKLAEAERWIYSMHKYEELAKVVAIADRELAQKRGN